MIKTLWRFKIKLMTYFGWGFAEISSPLNLVKSILIIIGGLVYLFKIHFSLLSTVLICIATFLICVGIGLWLKVTDMIDYANKISNDANPELKLIRKIAKHLNINE